MSKIEATPRYRAGIDTPLGVIFRDFTTRKTGTVIVTESILAAVARTERLNPAECELLTVVDLETGRLLWSGTGVPPLAPEASEAPEAA
jgi:hypothetical protein